MASFLDAIQTLNNLLWHDYVLYTVLASGIVFTFWSTFSQYRSLTHGVAVTMGHYDNPSDPGAINHFQALSTAMSSTVGLGNIGGVALAIALGGPGALFWMWVVGLIGMAIKMVEVTLAMLYRNVDDPDNPHGGPMWVARKAFAEMGWVKLGYTVGDWRLHRGKYVSGLERRRCHLYLFRVAENACWSHPDINRRLGSDRRY
jgi:AGCS family alanine or glycine:cation symporter